MCEWCSQSVSMVTCLCVQCPCQETGPATEHQTEAELSSPLSPSPPQPYNCPVLVMSFHKAPTRSSRQKCLQTSQSRQQGAFQTSHQVSKSSSKLDLDRRKQAYLQGRGLYPRSSGGSRAEDPFPRPREDCAFPQGRVPWCTPAGQLAMLGS